MDFSLSNEQRSLVNSFKRFATEYLTVENIRQWQHDEGLPDKVRRAFVEEYYRHPQLAGFEDRSGSLLAQALINEEMCRVAGASLPFASDIMHVRILQEFTAASDKARPLIEEYRTSGKLAFSLAVTEPAAGSDTMGMKTKVTRRSNRLFLDGRKTFVENGEYAPQIMVAALDETNTQATERPHLSFWLVPLDTNGIEAYPIDKIGQKILPFADLSFSQVELDPSWRLDDTGMAGFPRLFHVFEISRTLVCAQSLGMAQAALEDAVHHAQQREAFGQAIGDFQQIEQLLVDMEINVRAMRALVYEAAWAFDASCSDKRLAVALMKRFVPQAACDVASRAMQILGGRGYTTYERASWIWQDCRGNQIADGTDQIMVRIASPLLKEKYQ